MTGLPQLCAGNIERHNFDPPSDDKLAADVDSNETGPQKTKSRSICVTAYPKSLTECVSIFNY